MSEPIVHNVPISVFQGHNMNGDPSRRVFIHVKDLSTVPDELFAVKISQSKKPELAGRAVFKYFSYKPNDEAPFSSLAPANTTLQTPVAELKALALGNLAKLPDAVFSLAINMNGRFGNIKTPKGTYLLFDDERFPQSEGKPGYYLKGETEATVTLTQAAGQHCSYYRVQLETEQSPDEIFVKSGQSRVWGAEDDVAVSQTPTDASAQAPTNPSADTFAPQGGIW